MVSQVGNENTATVTSSAQGQNQAAPQRTSTAGSTRRTTSPQTLLATAGGGNGGAGDQPPRRPGGSGPLEGDGESWRDENAGNQSSQSGTGGQHGNSLTENSRTLFPRSADSSTPLAEQRPKSTPSPAAFETRVQELVNQGAKREHAENAIRSEDLAKNYEWIPGKGNLERDKGLVLKSQIAGGVPYGWRAHHIVPLFIAQHSKLFQRAAELGYNINRSSNGIALPYQEALSHEINLPIHSGKHLNDYFNAAIESAQFYEDMLHSGQMSDDMIKQAVGNIEHNIRVKIITGGLRLQTDGWPQ